VYSLKIVYLEKRRATAAQKQRLGCYVEPAEKEGFPFEDPLAKYKELLKHESSILI
jgi:hypothetical protein